MDEDAARSVLLVRAVERADQARQLITDADRRHAARAASELVRWSADERGAPAAPAEFLVRRAALLIDKLAERTPALARAVRALQWRPWVGVVLPVIAFVVGVLLQQVGNRQQINVLAFPLLSIVLWNLAVYAVLAMRAARGLVRPPEAPAGLRRAVLRAATRGRARLKGVASDAFASFLADWTRISAPLLGARAARVLHLSAALLALGALVGLYVRGLVFEYRAGWESTFLDATQVHALLSALLGPAAHALGMPFPSVIEFAALRWPGSAGENAARWIHWYALTVAALVVAPRLLLAASARWQEARRARRIPIVLDDPYFRRLLAGFAPHPVRMRVVPYSYTADEASLQGLTVCAKALLGDTAEITLRPVVAFGAESSATQGLDASDAGTAITAALFSLASTPEHENHGAFIDTLREALGERLIALIDESPYRRRLGVLVAAQDRLLERRNAWSAFCSAHRVTAVFVDLAAPDVALLERAVEPVIARR